MENQEPFKYKNLQDYKKLDKSNYKILKKYKDIINLLNQTNQLFYINIEIYDKLIFCISICNKDGYVFTIPIIGADKKLYFSKENTKEIYKYLKCFLQNNVIVLYDLFQYKKMFLKNNMNINIFVDLKLMEYFVFLPDIPKGLNELKNKYLYKSYDYVESFSKKFFKYPVTKIYEKSAIKSDYIFKIYHKIKKDIKKDQMELIARYTYIKRILLNLYINGVIIKNKIFHPNFHLEENFSGRITTSNPNIQNMKNVFKSRKGYCFVKADLKEAEFRTFINLIGSKSMKEFINSGKDIFKLTSKKILGTEDRNKGKILHYGILYGMTHYGLAQKFKISKTEAKKVLKKYNEIFRGFLEYRKKIIDKAKKNPIKNLFGRRYKFDIENYNEKTIFNTLIKSSVADLLHFCLVDICKIIKEKNIDAYFFMDIHDELVFEVAKGQVNVIKKIIEKVFEKYDLMKIDFEVVNEY